MTEYLGWIRSFSDAKDGQEIELLVQNLTPGPRKYESQIVRALVSTSRESMPEGDVLWLRTALGRPTGKPWAMKIIKELGVAIKGKPYS